jgi:hypothetical protein
MKAAVAISVVSLLAACERADAPPRPVPQPPALIAEVALPTLDGALAGVKQFVNAVQPGAGGFIIERGILNAAGLGILEGAAGDRPAHVLVVDPHTHARPLAALVGVADAAKLEATAAKTGLVMRARGGRAVVGDKAVVALVADWAFATLPDRPVPAVPVATAHSAALLAAYREDIEQAGATLAAEMQAQGGGAMADRIAKGYAGAALALLENSDRLEVRVEASASDASLVLAAAPKAGSSFAGLVAAQTASDFALLARLPPSAARGVLGGTLRLGPLREPVTDLMVGLFEDLYQIDITAETRAGMLSWADRVTGEFAAAIDIGPRGVQMEQLFGVSDPAAFHQAIDGFLATFSTRPIEVTSFGAKTRIAFEPAALEVDGVTFHRYTSSVDSTGAVAGAAPATALGTHFVGLFAVWDDVAGLSFGPGDPGAPRALVGATRGTAPRLSPPPRIAADLAAARDRKDSAYYFIDVAPFVAAALPAGVQFPSSLGISLGLNFTGGSAQLRVAVTSAEIKAVVGAAAALQAPAAPPAP